MGTPLCIKISEIRCVAIIMIISKPFFHIKFQIGEITIYNLQKLSTLLMPWHKKGSKTTLCKLDYSISGHPSFLFFFCHHFSLSLSLSPNKNSHIQVLSECRDLFQGFFSWIVNDINHHYQSITICFISAVSLFLSRATRPLSRRVGRSAGRSVRPSHFTFSAFFSCLKVE